MSIAIADMAVMSGVIYQLVKWRWASSGSSGLILYKHITAQITQDVYNHVSSNIL
jgi:hypothetical protein